MDDSHIANSVKDDAAATATAAAAVGAVAAIAAAAAVIELVLNCFRCASATCLDVF